MMMDFSSIKEFTYHIPWRAKGRHPGHHSSTQRGMGMEFRGHTTLLSYPDPRRIDLRQTIRDPLEQIYVRIFNQKSAIPVFAAFDLSGSMNFGRQQSKIALAAHIMRSIAQSTSRVGDPLGLIGFDNHVREDWLSPPASKPQHAIALLERLQDYHASNVSNGGIAEVYRYLPRERSLVFLISDFHMPLAALEQALALLVRHQIVPIVLWDKSEYETIPQFGIVNINDFETGEKRTLFLRKSLRERILSQFRQRREDIYNTFIRYDMPPLFVEDTFDADALSDYFFQFMAA